MLASVGTVTGNLNRLGDVLLQVVTCRSGVSRGKSVDTTDEGLQRNGVGIGPGIAVAGNGRGAADGNIPERSAKGTRSLRKRSATA